MSSRTSYPNLEEALTAVRENLPRARFDQGRWQQREAELKALVAKPGDTVAFFRQWSGASKYNSVELLDFSVRAFEHIGPSDEAQLFIGQVWLDELGELNDTIRQDYLLDLFKHNDHVFFLLTGAAAELIAHCSFSHTFMYPWIKSLRQRMGQNRIDRGPWKCIENYCKRSTSEALVTITVWQADKPDDDARNVIACMTAWIREAIGNEEGTLAVGLAQFEDMLRAPGSPEDRSQFIQSWAYSAKSALLTEEMLCRIKDELYKAEGNEERAWCFLLARLIETEPRHWSFALKEATRITRPALQAMPRHYLVCAIQEAWEKAEETGPVKRSDWEAAYFALHPVGSTALGTWNAVGLFLTRAMEADSHVGERLLQKLAMTAADQWFQLAAQMNGPLTYLGMMLTKQAYCTRFVTSLCLSDSAAERRLGIRLYEECKVENLDAGLITNADPRKLERIVHVCFLLRPSPTVIASIHRSLIPTLSKSVGLEGEAFKEAITFHAADTSEYRTAMAEAAKSNKWLRDILKEIKSVITQTNAARSSPALQMEVPGQARAAALAMRRMATNATKGAMDNSLMSVFGPAIDVRYSDVTRTYSVGTGLSPASKMRQTHVEMEVPVMGFMEPELTRWRQQAAITRLAELDAILNGTTAAGV